MSINHHEILQKAILRYFGQVRISYPSIRFLTVTTIVNDLKEMGYNYHHDTYHITLVKMSHLGQTAQSPHTSQWGVIVFNQFSNVKDAHIGGSCDRDKGRTLRWRAYLDRLRKEYWMRSDI